MTVQFHGITLDLPNGWGDITDELPEGSPPTLAKASGVGAVQFSIAKYRSGEKPSADFDDLRLFMIEFCQNNLIGAEHISARNLENMMCVDVLSKTDGQILSAWHLSNGKDFAFVTYVALGEESDQVNEELDDAREIISSISF